MSGLIQPSPDLHPYHQLPRRCGGRLGTIFSILLTLVSLSTTSFPLVAQTASGVGTRSCAAFLQAVEQGSDAAIDGYLSWAQGYISGVNATRRRGRDVAIDHAGLFNALAAYCTSNPQAKFFSATEALAQP